MKRPLCFSTVCYIIGIIMGLYLQISIVFLLCFSIVGGILIYCFFNKKKFAVYCLTMVSILMGFLSINLMDNEYENQYQMFQTDEKYKIEAIIISNVEEQEYKQVCEIEVKRINGDETYKGKKWLLNIKKQRSKDLDGGNYLKFGDKISFYGIIESPSTARNYMGFDYKNYLKSQKIYGTITAKERIKVIEDHQAGLIETLWHSVRNDMKKRIYQILPQDAREICLGILIGERKEINEEITKAFKESNLTHMLAVSGAHISYIVLELTLLFYKMRNRFRKILIIIFLLFFMGLTGFTPSVQRASLMVIFTLLASLLYRKQDIYVNISLSALLILLCNPYYILNIGFRLSYGGTIGIVLFYSKISNWLKDKAKIDDEDSSKENFVKKSIVQCDKEYILQKRMQKIRFKILTYIINSVAVTISANLVIIPIMAFQFNTISFTFWISNLLAGPFLGIITVLGFILYFISLLSETLASVMAVPLKYLIYLLLGIAKFCSQIPFSSILVRTPFILEIFVYYFLLFVFYFKRKNGRFLCILLFFTFEKNISEVLYRTFNDCSCFLY